MLACRLQTNSILRSSTFSNCNTLTSNIIISCSSSSSIIASTLTLHSAKRSAYFVHNKKTPNADCMMFVVPNFRFRIGNQAELEKAIREAHEAKYAPPPDEEEEDWDGPGPNLVGNKSNPETKEEREARVRKIAVEQFQVQRKEYLAQRDKMLSLAEAKERKLKQLQSDQQQHSTQKNSDENREGADEDSAAVAACDFSNESEENLFRKFSSSSTATATASTPLLKTPRTSGGSIHRAASMPQRPTTTVDTAAATATTTTTTTPNSRDGMKGGESKNQNSSSNKSITSALLLDDDDESTYVNATYSFVKETMHLSPLAKRIFDSEAGASINEVVVGKDFVTVRRKNEEDLLAEKKLEEEKEEQESLLQQEQDEQEEAAKNGGDNDEEQKEKKVVKKRRSIYNDGQGEIIATSLGTLSGMVNKNNNKNEKEEDQQGEKPQPGTKESEVEGAREKLVKMYAESVEKTEQVEKKAQEQQQRKDDDEDYENTNNSDSNSDAEKVVVPEWFDLQFPITGAITDHLHFAEVAVDLSAPHPYADTLPSEGDSEVISSIKELISEHLRPLLQSDGGDLRFVGFFPEQGSIIRVEMLGSCKTCKKSDTTLKDLIERTIRHFIPEVLGVEEVNKSVANKKK